MNCFLPASHRALDPAHGGLTKVGRTRAGPGLVRSHSQSEGAGADSYRNRMNCWEETELAVACPRAIP